MSDHSATLSTPRRWLKAFYSALAAALGYVIVELIMQHDTTWILPGALGILIVLTPIIFAINRRPHRAGR